MGGGRLVPAVPLATVFLLEGARAQRREPWEGLCDSPTSGQETVKKQPPGEAREGKAFSFFLSTCYGLGRDYR